MDEHWPEMRPGATDRFGRWCPVSSVFYISVEGSSAAEFIARERVALSTKKQDSLKWMLVNGA